MSQDTGTRNNKQTERRQDRRLLIQMLLILKSSMTINEFKKMQLGNSLYKRKVG